MDTELRRSGNPFLREGRYREVVRTGAPAATVGGTVDRTFVLVGLVMAGALAAAYVDMSESLARIGLVAAFVVALMAAVTSAMVKEWSPVGASVYAVAEGFVIGCLVRASPELAAAAGPTIVLTVGLLFAMLAAYRTRVIRVTPTFERGVILATAGIAIVYVSNFALIAIGVAIPFVHDWAIAGGWVAFALGAYALVVATLNLLLDVNAIEHDAARGAPKYMEWSGALSLLVTLVWIYFELLSHLGDGD